MKTIQVTFDDALHRDAKSVASRAGITLGELVRRAVAAFVQAHNGSKSGLSKRATS